MMLCSVLFAVLELNELAGDVGGAAGEMLMDDCAAKVRSSGLMHSCAPVVARLRFSLPAALLCRTAAVCTCCCCCLPSHLNPHVCSAHQTLDKPLS